MSDVKSFFESLSEVNRDLFVSVATDLQASAPTDKIKRLDDFHAQLKTEIDQINRRRQAIGGMVNNITSLLRRIDAYIVEKGETLEISMFRANLQKVIADLKAEVAALKPDKKLTKKYDVARRKESLEQRKDLAGLLFTEILGDTKARPAPVPQENVAELLDESYESDSED